MTLAVNRTLINQTNKQNPQKWFYFKKKVKFLGFVVSKDRIEANPEKVQKMVDWPKPTDPDDVRSFLGFCGYYRKFVEGLKDSQVL